MVREDQDLSREGGLLEIALSSEFCWSGGVSLPFLWTKTIAVIPAVLVVGGSDGCGVKNTPRGLAFGIHSHLLYR